MCLVDDAAPPCRAQDFGADLHQWTGNLTSDDEVPIVHSVSYGWQVRQPDIARGPEAALSWAPGCL
jgi:hypothetical protein